MELFASPVINGLSNMAVLFLAASGLVIIFGLLDVVNMAHGEFIMLGAYSACIGVNVLHIPFFAAVLFAAVFTGCLGFLTERIILRHLYGKVAETLLATFALSYIFQQLVRSILARRIN